MAGWTRGRHRCCSTWRAVFAAMLAAMAVAGALGLAFERVIVRPVYGQHLKQILITMGGMIVGEELIKVIWGPEQIPLPLPDALARLLPARRRGDREVPPAGGGRRACGVRRACCCVLNRTKIGLLIRAGVQDREMVESAGLPHPAPVRRRVRRRLGAGRPGRRDVGPVPAERDAADRRAGQRADLHRHHHRRPGLDAAAASSARCWSG